jgi:hypothetical protein
MARALLGSLGFVGRMGREGQGQDGDQPRPDIGHIQVSITFRHQSRLDTDRVLTSTKVLCDGSSRFQCLLERIERAAVRVQRGFRDQPSLHGILEDLPRYPDWIFSLEPNDAVVEAFLPDATLPTKRPSGSSGKAFQSANQL